MSIGAVLLALAAGLCFGLTSALQHWVASRQPQQAIGDARLLVRLARQPVWLASNVLDGLAIVLQTLALRLGSLTLVQPFLLSGLFFAVPAEGLLHRRPVRRRDLVGALMGTVGLALFLGAGTTAAGIDDPPVRSWLLASAAGLPVLAVLVGAAARAGTAGRALLLGTATGMAYGYSAALLKTCSSLLTHPVDLLTSWQLYAMLLVGAGAFVLNQNVFQARTLAAGLIALSITEPVVAAALGVWIFRERPDLDAARSVLLALAVAALVASVVLVAREEPEH